MIKKTIILSAITAATMAARAQQIYLPLDGNVTETVSSTTATVSGIRTLPYQAGVKGTALRTDGYSNYVDMPLSYTSLNTNAITMSLWLAPEAYPMMKNDVAEDTPTYALIAGNLDDSSKSGFGIMLSSQGNVKFGLYDTDKYVDEVVASSNLPVGQWTLVTATYDYSSHTLTIYINGEKSDTSTDEYYQKINIGSSDFRLAKDATNSQVDGMNLNGFSGIIDEVKVWNKCMTADEVKAQYNAYGSVAAADMAIAWNTSDNILRPMFHGMPAHNWTNECHGMAYSNGKYHLFFQKNGDGPYMSRLNWGHISSADLLNWHEERAAIVPSEPYDLKGCWSGAVFTDPAFNNGKPVAIYTAVDNAKARIAMAYAQDDDLLSWAKQGIIIDGKPSAASLSDDFRDPFFFTANGSKYIIVGSSNSAKLGTCVLYKYNASSWDYQGFFFTGTTAAACGTFWEMPNVTDLGGGKYLFTCTPQNTAAGVKTIYWIGTIGTDGKFTPEQADPQTFEAEETSKQGFGLLSPTIFSHDGKTIALGIVPDKVATSVNYNMGWAHNYSLPREISLGKDPVYGQSVIIGKPLSTIADYRGDETTTGRQIEMVGSFTYSSSDKQGFRFLKNGDNYAELSLSSGYLTLDLTHMQRTVNDDVYGGIYQTPVYATAGQTVNVDAILDGSIIDIFLSYPDVNGAAFSVRLFPTDASATAVEAFGNGTTKIYSLDTSKPTGIDEVTANTQYSVSNTQARKCLVNGQLCILRGGKTYSVSGARLK